MSDVKFKYYHGTRAMFLESIRKHGLGGVNPNIDFKNLDVLKYLAQVAEQNLRSVPYYEKIRDTTLAMAGQTKMELKDENGEAMLLNYKHDVMYVAHSRMRAAIYACLNKYGSEIIEKCLILIDLFKQQGVAYCIPEEINQFKIESLMGIESKPIIIEVLNLEDEFLAEETGQFKNILKMIRAKWPTLSEKQRFEFSQFVNFRVLKVIEPANLKFYEMDYEGHPRTGNFEFTLSPI